MKTQREFKVNEFANCVITRVQDGFSFDDAVSFSEKMASNEMSDFAMNDGAKLAKKILNKLGETK